jgi:hypothetical protein
MYVVIAGDIAVWVDFGFGMIKVDARKAEWYEEEENRHPNPRDDHMVFPESLADLNVQATPQKETR